MLDRITMFHIIKDERLVSKMEGKTIFSRRLETGWWLDQIGPDPRYFATDLRQLYTKHRSSLSLIL